MIAFEPYDIVEADMTSTATIAYDSTYFGANWQGEWAAGTYDEDDVVWEDLKIYQSATGSNTDQPSVGSVAEVPTWVELGYVNPWRMFDNYVGTAHLAITEAASPLVVTLETEQVQYVGLFGVNADTLLVERLDASDNVLWSEEHLICDEVLGIGDWYEYFFGPYPDIILRDLIIDLGYVTSDGEKIRITLTRSGGVVSCSNCFVGYGHEIGGTKWDVSVKAYNTGDTEFDQWGRTSFKLGVNYKTINATVTPLDGMEDIVLQQLSNLQNKAVVYDFNNDTTNYDTLRIYGAVTSLNQTLKGIKNWPLSIEVRGIVQKEEAV